METVGERIRKRRIELNITQEELAKRLGYKSRASVNNIENGRSVSQKIVEKFAQELHVTPSFLMGWDDLPDKQDFNGLDPNDINVQDLPKFDKPTKSDAKVYANSKDINRYHALMDLLKECNWNITKIKKGSNLNGIETDQTYYSISKPNGVVMNLTYDEFQVLQDKIYDGIETTILDEFKRKLGI